VLAHALSFEVDSTNAVFMYVKIPPEPSPWVLVYYRNCTCDKSLPLSRCQWHRTGPSTRRELVYEMQRSKYCNDRVVVQYVYSISNVAPLDFRLLHAN